jgi:hypothetical protein
MKKKEDIRDYISAHDAAQLLSIKHGRPIRPDYISKLAHSKRRRIRVCQIGDRLYYHRADIEATTIRERKAS